MFSKKEKSALAFNDKKNRRVKFIEPLTHDDDSMLSSNCVNVTSPLSGDKDILSVSFEDSMLSLERLNIIRPLNREQEAELVGLLNSKDSKFNDKVKLAQTIVPGINNLMTKAKEETLVKMPYLSAAAEQNQKSALILPLIPDGVLGAQAIWQNLQSQNSANYHQVQKGYLAFNNHPQNMEPRLVKSNFGTFTDRQQVDVFVVAFAPWIPQELDKAINMVNTSNFLPENIYLVVPVISAKNLQYLMKLKPNQKFIIGSVLETKEFTAPERNLFCSLTNYGQQHLSDDYQVIIKHWEQNSKALLFDFSKNMEDNDQLVKEINGIEPKKNQDENVLNNPYRIVPKVSLT